MRATGRLRAAAATVAVCVAGLVLALAAPESASAAGDLELSSDGVHFSATLPDSLFGDLGLLVPGGSADASLWIKNAGSTPADLRVRVTQLVTPSRMFASAVTLTTVHSGTSDTRSFDALGPCSVVVPSTALAAGAVTRVDLSVAMSPMIGGNATKNQSAQLGFGVDMRDAAAGPFPADGCDSGVTAAFAQALPSTGVDPRPALALAVALLAAGGLAALARRRRRDDRSEA